MKIYIELSIIVLLSTVVNSLGQDECSFAKIQSVLEKYERSNNIYEQMIQAYQSSVRILHSNLTQLQQQVHDYEIQLREQNIVAAEYVLNLKLKTDLIDCANKSLIKTQNQLNASENKVLELEKYLNQNKTELAAKINEIALKTEQINEMNSTIKEQNQQILIDNAQLKRQDERIAELESKLIACDEKIHKSNEQIADLTTQISSNADKLRELNEMIASFSTCCTAHSCVQFGNSSHIHTIQLTGVGAFKVLCNGQLNGPGWTVIQRRINGSVNFYRNWTEYRDGFGDLSGEFFIGLEKLHHMTKAEPQEIFIHMKDFDGDTRYVKYDNFEVGSEQESYALKSIGSYEGNISDQLRENEGQKFSTFDRDNDAASQNCAENRLGGWWYSKCGFVNLNGFYQLSDTNYDFYGKGIFWEDEWHSFEYSLKSVQILIRAKSAAKK